MRRLKPVASATAVSCVRLCCRCVTRGWGPVPRGALWTACETGASVPARSQPPHIGPGRCAFGSPSRVGLGAEGIDGVGTPTPPALMPHSGCGCSPRARAAGTWQVARADGTDADGGWVPRGRRAGVRAVGQHTGVAVPPPTHTCELRTDTYALRVPRPPPLRASNEHVLAGCYSCPGAPTKRHAGFCGLG